VTLLVKGEAVEFDNVYIKQIADGGFLLTIDSEKGTNQYYFSTPTKLAKAIREYYTEKPETQS
jgi:RecJ-like exonuclease